MHISSVNSYKSNYGIINKNTDNDDKNDKDIFYQLELQIAQGNSTLHTAEEGRKSNLSLLKRLNQN